MLRIRSSLRRAVVAVVLPFAIAGTAQAGGKHAALRKFVLPNGDANEARVLQTGGKVLVRYGAFTLYGIADTTKAALSKVAGTGVAGVSERLELRGGKFQDTRRGGAAKGILKSKRAKAGGEFQVVQFIGPVLKEWSKDLQATGAKVVSYMPENGYVVWIDDASRVAFETFVSSDFVQWSGDFEPSWRRSPKVEAASALASGYADVTVQLLDGPESKATLEKLRSLASRVIQGPGQVLSYLNISLTVPAKSLADISSWPDVFNVEEYVAPFKRDEAQGQIMAGNIYTSGGNVVPQGPGYLTWLASKGFPTTPESYPVVDIVDDGIDVGDAVNVRHPDFRRLGDSSLLSRLSYIQTCTSDPLGDGLEGHGNINAGIVGGYNDGTAGFPYQDALGYHYGLGVSPYGRLAGTRIFGSTGSWDVSRCGSNETGIIQRAYAAGAKITSNSWGASVGGAYTASSQAYDAGTRDASSTLAGNQEILHVFSAGNSGSGTMTIGAPGTAKNVLTVGATENVRAEGTTDGCGIANSNNADDIIYFSSRGPTSDGRIKPDIMAPGVHITGPASQDPGFNGGSVCGMGSAGFYYPLGQTLYTWSSGTSHSCPAVSGTAQLTYEHYTRVLKPGAVPSPAMLKALIVNGARYMTGLSAGGTLPSPQQGWGDVNMGTQFDGTPRELVDQSVVFQQTGEQYALAGSVSDPTKPLRISLVWTDAPGNTTGASYVNDLDLEVEVNGVPYKGNVFSGAFSTTGGVADAKNNIENVFLPAGTSGSVVVRVVAKNIAGDGVPANADATDQDFALVAYNVITTPRAILAPDSVVVRKVEGNPAVGIEPGDSLEIRTAIRNAGTLPLGASTGWLSTSDSHVTIGMASTSYAPLAPSALAWGVQTYGVRISPSLPCGSGVLLLETIRSDSDTLVRQIRLTGNASVSSDTSFTVPVAIRDYDSSFAMIHSTRSGTVASLKVRVGIAHTYDADLVVSLVSPSGKRVVLASQVGGSGDNFSGTIFDDSALVSIVSGTAPFAGSYRPSSPLSVFSGDSVKGTWTLVVADRAGADIGTIQSFVIDFKLNGGGCTSNTAPAVRITSPSQGAIVELGDTVALRATVTDDGKPSPSSLTYRWRKLSGPGSVEFSDSTALASGARFPALGAYLLQLVVSDGQLSGGDTVVVQVVAPLTAPTGLVATSMPGAIQLSWDSLSGPGILFDIYRSIGDSLHFSPLDSSSVNSYVDRRLTSDTTYFYKIASRRNGVVRVGGQIVSAKAMPLSITGLRLTSSGRTVRLAWNPVTPIGLSPTWTYVVERSTSPSGPFELVQFTTDTTAIDTGLVPGNLYYYSVGGSSSDSRTATSAQDTIRVAGVAALPAPENFIASARSRSVFLRWSQVVSSAGPVTYRLFRFGMSLADTLSVMRPDTFFVDTGLVNGVQYHYELRAVDRDTSSFPVFAAAIPRADTLSSPRSFVATARSRSVFLRWSPVVSPAGAVTYRLFRFGMSLADTLSVTRPDTFFVDTGLVNGVQYHYELRAVDRDTSSFPVFAAATPRADTLSSPRSFVATARSRSVFLRWSPVVSSAGPVTYRLFRFGLSLSDTLSVSLPDTSYLDTGLTNGVSYQYELRATNRDTMSLPAFATALPHADTLAAPTALSAMAGNRSVSLLWNPSAGATGYTLFRAVESGAFDSLRTTSGTAIADTGLADNTLYSYFVKATNAEGSSLPSATVSVRTNPAIPAPPTGVVATSGIRSVAISWNPSVGAAGYDLFRSADSMNFTLLVSVSGTSWLDSGLMVGARYWYYLKAKNAAGSSAASPTVFAEARPPVPSAPVGLVATAGDRSIHLVWSTVPFAATYSVKTATVSGGPYTLVQSGLAGTSFDLGGLSNGATYFVVVSASNASGEGANSAPVSATPTAPGGLKVLYKVGDANPNDNTIRPLLQIANTGATAVNLSDLTVRYWYTNAPSQGQAMWCDWAQIGSGNVAGTYRSLSTPVSGADGYMEISFRTAAGALAAGGNSGEIQIRISRTDWSNHNETGDWSYDPTKTAFADWSRITLYRAGVLVWGTEPGVATPPSVPAGLRGAAGDRVDTLAWNAASNATSYRVYRNAPGGAASVVATTTSVSFVDTGLVNGLSYVYRVSGVNGSQESAKSDSIVLAPRGVAPSKVTGLVATAGNRVVSLAWNASSTATSYKVLRDGSLRATVAGTSFSDTAVSNDITYGYRVVASNAWGDAAASDSISATPRAPLVPGVPSGLRGNSGDRVDSLVWNAAANATSYNVYRGPVGGASAKIGATASTSFVDTGLVNGLSYVYRVSGVNGSQESAKSDSIVLAPRGVAPAKVTGLVATAGNRVVSLAWNASSTATSYKVLRDGSLRATVAGTSFSDTAVTNDITYGYRVVASNAWGDAAASDSVSATPRAPVGGLKVQYKAGTTDAATNGIRPFLQVVNSGSVSIPLSEVTVRYWFTNDGTQGVSYWCDWAQIGSGNLQGIVRTVSPAKPTADRYLEISFKASAGNLAAGASTGEIQSRFSKSDWSNFTQSNDASFDATRTSYADHAKVTVYRNGFLVWGVEP